MATKPVTSVQDAVETIVAVLENCRSDDHFMIAFWKVDGNGLRLERVTYQMPVKEFGKAIELLQSDLEANEAYDEPLPEAMFPFNAEA